MHFYCSELSGYLVKFCLRKLQSPVRRNTTYSVFRTVCYGRCVGQRVPDSIQACIWWRTGQET